MLSTIKGVNAQSVEMNLCIRSYARNPVENNDLNLALMEEIVNETQVNSQNEISRTKRPRHDSPHSMEKPPTKRITKNEDNATSTDLIFAEQNKNPLKVLNRLYPNLKFNFEAEMGSALVPYFMISAEINKRKFFGHGKSKKVAKIDAAKQILKYLEEHKNKVNMQENGTQPSKKQKKNWNGPLESLNTTSVVNTFNPSIHLNPYLANIMQTKVLETFDKLTRGHEEVREYKVLAGIVMTTNMNFEDAVVVSLATGTKCVNGGNICCNGSVLNDSHAEIIAKRGLMKFLYTQLRWHCSSDMCENSIFQRNPYGNPYSLKENVHFHLYINTAPCGDARIFSFNQQNNFNSGQYGKLRTKVEGGMGTTPVGDRYYPQTWDGVVLGEPLLTMSCSDKIALWNVVGIQGALLSQLIEPIYLSSIVLGSMFNDQHLYRAICGRIQHTLGYLPQPYRLNRPLLGQTQHCLPRNTSRVPGLGINWTIGDENIEIISLPSGRKIYNETSYLAKQAFFYKFHYLLNNLPNIGCAVNSNNYAEAKQNARDFQKAKSEAISAFYRAELGCWVKKPIEQNEFYMN
ncbi:double-stranded RNA-specific editase Adar-like [Cochliomyia hominivorax]